MLNPIGMPAGVRIEDAESAVVAWNRYAEVNITLAVDLTVQGGDTPDGVNVISFGGSGNAMAQTFSSVNGDEITESDIVFNAGHEEALSRPGQFASMLCHEIGHVLGLGHSEDKLAMMYAVAHGPERGATLAPDDRAAIQFVYQPKSPTGPLVSRAKAKNNKLTISGETDEAVSVWMNGGTYKARRKGSDLVIKGDFPMVGKGYNVLVVNTPTGSSDPFFF